MVASPELGNGDSRDLKLAVGGASLPVPKFDGPTIVFGAPRSSYLTKEQMGDDFYAMRGRFCDIASSLFYSGGSLAGHGLRFKPGIDRADAMGAIKAWLCSFDPKHEIKIGTVGFALSQWCEDAPAAATPATPHQAQRKKARKGGHRIRKTTTEPQPQILGGDQ